MGKSKVTAGWSWTGASWENLGSVLSSHSRAVFTHEAHPSLTSPETCPSIRPVTRPSTSGSTPPHTDAFVLLLGGKKKKKVRSQFTRKVRGAGIATSSASPRQQRSLETHTAPLQRLNVRIDGTVCERTAVVQSHLTKPVKL